MRLIPSHLRTASKRSLGAADRPGRIILLHTGAILLISLLLSIADHLLDKQISTTGGLSGLGARSALTTIQSLLQLMQVIVLPFWQLGYTYYTLKVAREQPAGLSDLTAGFRRFGPVLRLKMLTAGMIFLLAMISGYVSAFLFMLSPWSSPMMQQIANLTESAMDEQALAQAMAAITADAAIPVLILFCLCFLAGGLFLFCRYRLAELWLMDHPKSGALAALRSSRIRMQGNWKALFRVDLSFWWFYLLEILIAVLSYGDIILDALGIEMTTDAFGSYLLFFSLYLWAQMALYWWKKNEISVTYAHAYLTLCADDTQTA